MAQNLAIELYFLIEHLISIDSPLVQNVKKYYKIDYFSDLVGLWKRLDAQTQELAELKRSIQQLSGLMLQTPIAMVPPPPFHIDYAGFQVQEQLPNAEQLFANMPPSSINEDDKKTKSKTKSPKKNKNNSKTSQ